MSFRIIMKWYYFSHRCNKPRIAWIINCRATNTETEIYLYFLLHYEYELINIITTCIILYECIITFWKCSWFIISLGFMFPQHLRTNVNQEPSSVLRMFDYVGAVIISSYSRVHFKIVSLRMSPQVSFMSEPTESTLKQAWNPAWKTKKTVVNTCGNQWVGQSSQ